MAEGIRKIHNAKFEMVNMASKGSRNPQKFQISGTNTAASLTLMDPRLVSILSILISCNLTRT